MDYELAKKLKDAGFPMILKLANDAQEVYELPTLEELIEACGDKFQMLVLDTLDESVPGKWSAHGWEYRGNEDEYATPTAAVANLWLALNPKKS